MILVHGPLVAHLGVVERVHFVIVNDVVVILSNQMSGGRGGLRISLRLIHGWIIVGRLLVLLKELRPPVMLLLVVALLAAFAVVEALLVERELMSVLDVIVVVIIAASLRMTALLIIIVIEHVPILLVQIIIVLAVHAFVAVEADLVVPVVRRVLDRLQLNLGSVSQLFIA